MVIRVLPVENAGSTSPRGRNSAAWVRVNAGLSASGVADRGDASTAAQLMATGASEALSFKLVLLTVVGLSERNNVRALWRGAAKHHHHQASFNPVVPNESGLWVSLARVFSHLISASNMTSAAKRGRPRSRTLVSFLMTLHVNSIWRNICILVCISQSSRCTAAETLEIDLNT